MQQTNWKKFSLDGSSCGTFMQTNSHERREPQAVAFDRVKLPAVEEQRNLFFSLVVGKAYAS